MNIEGSPILSPLHSWLIFFTNDALMLVELFIHLMWFFSITKKESSTLTTILYVFFLVFVYFLVMFFEISFKAKSLVTNIASMLFDFFMNTLKVPP